MQRIAAHSYLTVSCSTGEDAAQWLTKFLGKDVRLVKYVGEQLSSIRGMSLCFMCRSLA